MIIVGAVVEYSPHLLELSLAAGLSCVLEYSAVVPYFKFKKKSNKQTNYQIKFECIFCLFSNNTPKSENNNGFFPTIIFG